MENQMMQQEEQVAEPIIIATTTSTILGFTFVIKWEGPKYGLDQYGGIWWDLKNPRPNQGRLNEILDNYNLNLKQ